MTHSQFVSKYLGKFVDVDGYPKGNPYQCTDLMRRYITDVYGLDSYKVIPGDTRGAKYYFWNYQRDYPFKKVINTKTNIPSQGDIVFFKTSILPPWLFGISGHVAIVDTADIKNLIVFQQNWPTGSSCQLHKFDLYKDCLGWLHKV